MKRVSQTDLLRLTSRAGLLAGRALVYGPIVACCIGTLGAAVWTWGSPPIGAGLVVLAVTVVAGMFCLVAAAFFIGGYARFRARAAGGRTASAYTGLAVAIAGAALLAWVGVSGLAAVLIRFG